MFNYRYSKMTYGFVARQRRKHVITQPARNGKLQYSFATEPLCGVQKDTPYKVQLKLPEAETGKELVLVEQVFKSDVERDTLPTKALVVGIRYQLAPDN